ncbi:MAG: hypothetical protein ACT4TC_15630, partial [Myxococcaceae bacterium]
EQRPAWQKTPPGRVVTVTRQPAPATMLAVPLKPRRRAKRHAERSRQCGFANLKLGATHRTLGSARARLSTITPLALP